jgi:hypothetical protein
MLLQLQTLNALNGTRGRQYIVNWKRWLLNDVVSAVEVNCTEQEERMILLFVWFI